MDTKEKQYSSSVLTPKTSFPMKAALAEREPARLKQWEEGNLYARIQERRAGRPTFILHDGPPYANGDIHLGHALNKILKDVIVRYKTMKGFASPYVPGWDCHGLPIEQQVSKKLGPKLHAMPPEEVRKLCQEYAAQQVEIQKAGFKRIGVSGDWENPYLTYDPHYEAGILSVLRDLVERGLVRKGLKPVHWDPVFRTALAEAEIEYDKHVSDSIYVKFPVLNSEKYPELAGLEKPSVVIWTTTPWTLPANVAVSLSPDFDYVALRHGGEHFIVAKELAGAFLKACSIEGAEEVRTFKAAGLDRAECSHPIHEGKTSLIILGKHVTLEVGTGCVHTAPGHGMDDFIIGKQYGLPVVMPVDDAGRYTAEFPAMQGVFVFDANPKIVEDLQARGLLLAHAKYEHDYPHSWRSRKPIIFRATEQWFMELAEGGVRERAIKAIDDEVKWIPSWGRERIVGMVSQRPDWCLSRQRSWGVPIPAFRHKDGGSSILNAQLLDRFIKVVETQGTNAWYTEPLASFWPEGFVDPVSGSGNPEDFVKEWDILDVWFDSGASHVAVLENDPLHRPLSSPADLYLEGSDQHRGWFQSALLLSIGARDRAPFRQVLTHGFLLDGQGRAMSKSLGNVISPLKIADKLGADVLRLWVCSEDYRVDMRASDQIFDHIAEAYRRVRNTFRFLIGNLHDFDPATNAVPYEKLEELDQWALSQLAAVIEKIDLAFDEYQFHKVFHLTQTFCHTTLSAVYLDVLKDRLYCSAPGDATRRAAQTVVHHIFDALCRAIAPILVFTGEEVWEFGGKALGREVESLHLQDFPVTPDAWKRGDLDAKWERLLQLREEVALAIEPLRRAKEVGHSLDCEVEIAPADAADAEFVKDNLALLKPLFIVSGVQLTAPSADLGEDGRAARSIKVRRSAHGKCERCWMYDEAVGQDADHPGLCGRCADVIRRV